MANQIFRGANAHRLATLRNRDESGKIPVHKLGLDWCDMEAEIAWIRQARHVLQAESHLFRARPARYWLDFAMSLVLAYTSASIFLTWPLFSWQQFVAYPFAIFWL